MHSRTVAVLGGVVQNCTHVLDRVPDRSETITSSSFTMSPGGKGANSSVATHRLSRAKPKQSHDAESETSMEGNIQVRMVGAVGADQFGPALKDNLIACGVNADGVRIVEGQQTAVSSILVERAKNGANRIMQFPGAAYSLEPTDFMTLESLGGGVAPDLVISQLELRRETVEQAIETAHKHNVEVLLNPSPAFYIMPDIFPMVTHLVMNEVEAGDLSSCKPDDIDKLTGWTSVAKYFHELGVKNVVVTLGEKGAYYSNEVESGKVEAEKYCRVVDTAGAG